MACFFCLEPNAKFVEVDSNRFFCNKKCQFNFIQHSEFDDILKNRVPNDVVQLILRMIPVINIKNVLAIAYELEQTDNTDYINTVLHIIKTRFPKEDARLIFVFFLYNACFYNLPKLLNALFEVDKKWRPEILTQGMIRAVQSKKTSADILRTLLSHGANPQGEPFARACQNNNALAVFIMLPYVIPSLDNLKDVIANGAVDVLPLLLSDSRLDILENDDLLLQVIKYVPFAPLDEEWNEWDYENVDKFKRFGDMMDLLLKDPRVIPTNEVLINAVDKSFIEGVRSLLHDGRVDPTLEQGKLLKNAAYYQNAAIFSLLLNTNKFSRELLREIADQLYDDYFKQEIEDYLSKTERDTEGVSETKRLKEKIFL